MSNTTSPHEDASASAAELIRRAAADRQAQIDAEIARAEREKEGR